MSGNNLGFALSLGALAAVAAMGPGRALTLAARSMLAKSHHGKTDRTKMLSKLKYNLAIARRDEYFILHGPSGVGKTTLIDSLVHKRPGVMRILVNPADKASVIMDNALRAITNLALPTSHANVVLWWYSLIPFVPKPLMIIQSCERNNGDPFAPLTGVVRELTEDYGIQVLVEGTENALQPELFRTYREHPISVEPFLVEELAQLQEFKPFFKQLEVSGDRDLCAVVRVLAGGYPTTYTEMIEETSAGKQEDFASIVKNFLLRMLDAERVTLMSMCALCEAVRPLYEQFSQVDRVRYSVQARPSPDRVLRVVRIDHDYHLVPSTPAMAFYLRHRRALTMTGSQEDKWQDVVLALKADQARLQSTKG
jgi:hypothetical protein